MADTPACKRKKYMRGGETCMVCDDRATGYHYHVLTCEGCKGFFRRTEQKRIQYVCKEGGQCPITVRSRNACHSCRYQKCLAKGMAKDLVLNETARLRKQQLIQKNREMRAWQKARAATKSKHPAPTPSLTPSQLQFMKSAQLAFSAALSEGCRTQFTTEECVEGQEAGTLVTFVLQMVDFYKRLPALGNMRATEYLPSLLSGRAVDLCLLVMARTRVAPDGSFRTLEGNLTLKELCTQRPQLSSLLDHVLSIHTVLRACSLDDAEFALLLILVLLQTDRSSGADQSNDSWLLEEVEARPKDFFELLVGYAALRAPERGHLANRVIRILVLLRDVSEKSTPTYYMASPGQTALTSFASLFFSPSSYNA